MVEEERNDMKSSAAEKVWSFGWDKKYFVRLWIHVKRNLKQGLVTFIGLTYLLTLTLLYLEVKAVDAKVWGGSVVVGAVVMTILLRPREYFRGLWQDIKKNWKQNLVVLVGLACLLAVTLLYLKLKVIDVTVWAASLAAIMIVMLVTAILLRRRKHRKVVRRNFDPVSLGTLWFSFALTLWIGQPIREWYTIFIEVCFSIGALAFLVAVFSRSMRMFLNTEVAPEVMFFTLLAFVFGFTVGWLPALSQVSGAIREVIVYFGFLWVVVMLVVMFRDVKNELARILFVVFFFIAALIRFWERDIIGVIGGIALLIIAAVLYLVATSRVHPYGEVSGE